MGASACHGAWAPRDGAASEQRVEIDPHETDPDAESMEDFADTSICECDGRGKSGGKIPCPQCGSRSRPRGKGAAAHLGEATGPVLLSPSLWSQRGGKHASEESRGTVPRRCCSDGPPELAGAEQLDELVGTLERTASALIARYRSVLVQNKGDAESADAERRQEVMRRADEGIRRVQQQLRGLQRFTSRQTWPRLQDCDEESELWGNMYMGSRKRFKNLHDVMRKVQVENQIIRHWRGQQRMSHNNLILAEDNSRKLEIDIWDGVDVFAVDKECQRPLTHVFMAIWKSRSMNLLCKAPEEKVLEYISAVEAAYKQNPYHNRVHAADVTLTSYFFWSQLAAQRSFRDYFHEVDLLVVVVAAAIHDVAHPAVNNDYLVKTRDTLALRYNDRSVLENYHAATAFRLMKETGVALLEHNLPSPPHAALRARVIDMVLATDMAHHKRYVEDLASELGCHQNLQDIDKLVLEKLFVHMADIAHPLRPPAQHKEWSRRVTEEFLTQGDQEKARGLQPMALFDREKSPSLAKGQLGFLNFVVVPTWMTLCQVLGPASKPPDKCLRANQADWEALAALEEKAAPANGAAKGKGRSPIGGGRRSMLPLCLQPRGRRGADGEACTDGSSVITRRSGSAPKA